MTDHPECTCPHLDHLTRLGLEGLTVPACDIHRPARGADELTIGESPALNSDALTDSIAARLGGAQITTTL